MNRKAELEFRLRIERKNYKVAARKYRSELRWEWGSFADTYRRAMQDSEKCIDTILKELATIEAEKPKANDYLRPRYDVWWESQEPIKKEN